MLQRAKTFLGMNSQSNGKIPLPDYKWLEGAERYASHTPDVVQLEQNLGWHLFVYDNLMKGYTEHALLSDAEERATAFTAQRFALWQAQRGKASYPIALRSNAPYAEASWTDNRTVTPTARIKGQLYFVPPSVIIKLDGERHNGVLFHRERVDVSVPFHKSDEHPREANEYIANVPAFMYIGDEDYWFGLLDGGWHFRPGTLQRPRPSKWMKEDFYYFMNWEK